MRWYLNDVSLQGQFADQVAFEAALRQLITARGRLSRWQCEFRTTRNLSQRAVTEQCSLRDAVYRSHDNFLKGAILRWLEHVGPFVEEDRLEEVEDYFEFAGIDVTDSGLGEATRRVKVDQVAATFSFVGGPVNFSRTPLSVDHGLEQDRLGAHNVENAWTLEDLEVHASTNGPRAQSWRELVERARTMYPRLAIPNSVYENALLSREPFDAVIRDRALVLMGYLNQYMESLEGDGTVGAAAREILNKFFVGERALFTGESATNRTEFARELTFPDPDEPAREIFAHWHGKISHRFFRLHFEWPLPSGSTLLKVVYLGPKLTKV